MRKVMYTMTVSLDGFIESADGRIDWTVPSEELHQHFNDREAAIEAHLYGRRLYELMARDWPPVDENPSAPAQQAEYAKIWKNKPKVVFSKTLDRVAWNSRLVRGDIVDEVERLKRQPGRYMSVGGPGLASSFTRLGLIDEYWLYVCPLILGGGKPMFQAVPDKIELKLLETQTFAGGTTLLRYERLNRGAPRQ